MLKSSGEKSRSRGSWTISYAYSRYLHLKQNFLDQIPYGAISSLKQLAVLDLESNNITELQRYADATFSQNITLNLSSNRITALPAGCLSPYMRIVALDLSYNQIGTLHTNFLDGVQSMQSLDLSYNRLQFIPVNSLFGVADSLKHLNLEENQLTTLPEALMALKVLESLNLKWNKLITPHKDILAGLKFSMKELSLSHNYLDKIPTELLEGFKSIETLDLSKNHITTLKKLAFGKFDGIGANLVKLNLAGNKIQSLSEPGAFLYMSGLVYLDLSYNCINYVAPDFFNLLPGLESLSLQNNRISTIPSQTLVALTKLRYLILDGNEIDTFTPSSFLHMQNLERLSASHNNIVAVSYNVFPGNHLLKLRSINLAFNMIHSLYTRSFSDLNALEVADLRNNFITVLHVHTFINLPSLRFVYLDRNRISTTSEETFVNIPRLELLSLKHNRISSLPQRFLIDVSNLKSVDLSYNNLRNFDATFLSGATSLQFLDLSYNNLGDIDLAVIKHSIVHICLSHNRIASLKEKNFGEFPSLTYLDLSHNRIIKVHATSFLASPNLNKIFLSYNNVTTVSKNTFATQKNFACLDLSHNLIEELDMAVFGENNVMALNLSFNNFRAVPYAMLHNVQKSLGALDLGNNRIATLESNFFDGLRNLTHMCLRSNAIQKVSESAFKGLHKLRSLDLSHNPVNEWNPNSFRDIGHSVEAIDLANTGLFTVPKLGGRAIKMLNLSLNHIFMLNADDLPSFQKLENLDVSYNQLRFLSHDVLGRLMNLKSLNVSHNPLQKVTANQFDGLRKLETLEMHHMPDLNQVDVTAFRSFRNLKELKLFRLSEMQHSIDVQRLLALLPPLKTLHIEVTNESVDQQFCNFDARFLRDLRVEGRQIKRLATDAFRNLRGYKMHLSLANTKVSRFPAQVFSLLNHITFLELDLSDNYLETLQPFLFSTPPLVNGHGTMLVRLNVAGNPLLCDCRLNWVKPWFEHLRMLLSSEEFDAQERAFNDTVCHSVSNSRNIPLFKYIQSMRCLALRGYVTPALLFTCILRALLSHFE
ncbi:unnamed protein product [Soboliphyme baturini]|uniref:Chaoptin n=1 Tax=Soboliphyme baturini TaxID=241478 RepID=A0A183IUG0_9BILA|nr:unnamed protein product [Soboliphyme baturini]